MKLTILLLTVLAGVVSCGTNFDRPDQVFTAEERALFLSPIADRGDRIDALVAARKPRPGAGSLSADEARRDLGFLFATIERVHPSYWLALGGFEGYSSWKLRAQRWLDHLTLDGRVSRVDLALVLAYAVAGLEDAHTGVPVFWGAASDLTDRPSEVTVPPWPLVWRGDRWVVDGSEVRLLNGRPPEQTLEPLLLAVPAESVGWKSTVASRCLALLVQMVDPFAGVTRFRAELTDGRVLEGPPGNWWRFSAVQESLGSDEPPRRSAFTDLGGGVGLYDYRSFDDSEVGLKAMDAVFRQAVAAGTTDLIVDLRANGGGSTNAGEALLGHLTTHPFRQFRTIVRRWPTEAMAEGGWFGAPEGTWSRYEVSARPAAVRQPVLQARLHLLVGPFTFSSASTFAQAVLDYGLGDLWGYETGGVRACAGNRLQSTLPATGWMFSVSQKAFFGPQPAADETRHGAVPDHPATLEALAPYVDEVDPLLAWAVASLRASPRR